MAGVKPMKAATTAAILTNITKRSFESHFCVCVWCLLSPFFFFKVLLKLAAHRFDSFDGQGKHHIRPRLLIDDFRKLSYASGSDSVCVCVCAPVPLGFIVLLETECT